MLLAGGLDPDNVAEAIAVAHPFAVDVASGVEAEPGVKDHAKMAAFFEARHRRRTQERGGRVSAAVEERFGPYGGRFVPEVADRRARRARPPPGPRRATTPASAAELDALLRDFVGRPTPLYLAERSPSASAAAST